MKTFRGLLGILMAIQVVPAPGVQQNEIAYDLAGLLKRANGGNLFLQAERLEIKAREARALQAGLRANPTLMANSMKEILGADNYLGAGASQPLELFGRRDARKAAALADVEIAKAEVAEQEEMLAARVRAVYAEVLAAERDLELLRELAESNRQTHKLLSERIAAGATPPLEGNLQIVEIRKLEAQIAAVEGTRETSLLELKTLISLPPEQILRITGDLETEPQLPTLPDARAEALRKAELKRIEAAEKATLAEIDRARTEAKLDVTVSAEYRRSNMGFGIRGFNDAGELTRVRGIFHMLMFGANITLPLFNRNQGQIAEFRTQAEQQASRRRFLELSIQNQLLSGYRQVEKLDESLLIYKGALRMAQENTGVVRKKYELGAIPLLDLLQDQRRYLEIQMGYTDLARELFNARSRILRSIGRVY